MPSQLFAFICTKSSADFVIPANARDLGELSRRVSIFAKGLVGGTLTVGDIKFRPTEAAIPNHMLCDGSTISRGQFPQLVEFLNPGEDTATLPDYTGSLEIEAPTVEQTVTDSGTVSTDDTIVIDAGDTGGTTGGNVTTGGRIRQVIRPDEELP